MVSVNGDSEPATATKSRWGDLLTRVIYGIIFAAIALFCLLFHSLTFYAMVMIIALLMYQEWSELTRDDPLLSRAGGLIYVGLPVWSFLALYDLGGSTLLLVLISMVVATDVFAYFGGKRFGRHKIAPSISPGKSWEGLACGVAAAMIAGAIASFYSPYPSGIVNGLVIGLLIALTAQAGDFFESHLKRRAGVKDSGTLIPGHGGILDRMDGLTFAAPAFALLLWL